MCKAVKMAIMQIIKFALFAIQLALVVLVGILPNAKDVMMATCLKQQSVLQDVLMGNILIAVNVMDASTTALRIFIFFLNF